MSTIQEYFVQNTDAPKAEVPAAELKDDELLAELKRRGLLLSPRTGAIASPPSFASTCSGRLGSVSEASSPTSSKGTNFCSPSARGTPPPMPELALGAKGGPLLPGLAGAKQGMRFTVVEGKAATPEYSWSYFGEHDPEAPQVFLGPHQKVATATSATSWVQRHIGHEAVHVKGPSGAELFSLQHTPGLLSVARRETSFRVLAPGPSDSEALFTVVKDSFSALKLQEVWRIYRGEKKEGSLVYYCTGSSRGSEHKVFRSKEAAGAAGARPAARIQLAEGTGTGVIQDGGVPEWCPARFEVAAGPGEDGALLLALVTAMDLSHAGRKRVEGTARI